MATTLGALGIVGAAIGWASGRKGQREAQAASAEAAKAQRDAAEALKEQAAVQARTLELQERLSRPRPVRFSLQRGNRSGRLVNVGGLPAADVNAETTTTGAVYVDVISHLPARVEPGEAIDFAWQQGGHPGTALIRLRWQNEDGSLGEQEVHT